MKCEKIPLNYGGTGKLYTYILDPEISYGVKRKWPAMIICPGGGYMLTATKEGEAVAAQFLSNGYHCFVLRYSTFLNGREAMNGGVPSINHQAHYPAQALELLESIRIIREHAEEWNVDTDQIYAVGFSAGGHVVGTAATRWNDNEVIQKLNFVPEVEQLKLNGIILGYPMLEGDLRTHMEQHIQDKDAKATLSQISLINQCLYKTENPTEEQMEKVGLFQHVSKDTCPVFLWHTTEDTITNAKTTTKFALKLLEQNIPCEYHLFQKGPHGLACANEHYAKSKKEIDDDIAMWIPLAIHWLKKLRGKNNE